MLHAFLQSSSHKCVGVFANQHLYQGPIGIIHFFDGCNLYTQALNAAGAGAEEKAKRARRTRRASHQRSPSHQRDQRARWLPSRRGSPKQPSSRLGLALRLPAWSASSPWLQPSSDLLLQQRTKPHFWSPSIQS